MSKKEAWALLQQLDKLQPDALLELAIYLIICVYNKCKPTRGARLYYE